MSGKKQVHFNEFVQINVFFVWPYAYRCARNGDIWQKYARDTARFEKRIDSAKENLSKILQTAHRDNIFRERFQ